MWNKHNYAPGSHRQNLLLPGQWRVKVQRRKETCDRSEADAIARRENTIQPWNSFLRVANGGWAAGAEREWQEFSNGDRRPNDTHAPTSHSTEGEKVQPCTCAHTCSPVQPSFPTFLRKTVSPLAFVVCNISCAGSWGHPNRNHVLTRQIKGYPERAADSWGGWRRGWGSQHLLLYLLSDLPPHLCGTQISLRLGTGTSFVCLFICFWMHVKNLTFYEASDSPFLPSSKRAYHLPIHYTTHSTDLSAIYGGVTMCPALG